MSFPECPKCHYIRRVTDSNVHEGICPACGIAYQKWLDKHAATTQKTNKNPAGEQQIGISEAINEAEDQYDNDASFKARLQATLTYIPTPIEPVSFQGRCLTLALILLWSLWFVPHGIDWEIIGGSFMHNVILPFHEFGHVFFSPFGEFMMILGGSLFQILMPLCLMAAFVIQQRDNFAGAVMLWWCGESFVDLAPYIRDAEYRMLPLVGGGSESSHDWGNLLTMLDVVDSCYTLAKLCFAIGVAIMLLGVVWGAYILRLQYQVVQNSSQY
jgi:hypothetical protein